MWTPKSRPPHRFEISKIDLGCCPRRCLRSPTARQATSRCLTCGAKIRGRSAPRAPLADEGAIGARRPGFEADRLRQVQSSTSGSPRATQRKWMDGCGSRSDTGNLLEPSLAEDEDRLRANLDQTHCHTSAKSPSQSASVAVPHHDQHHVPLRRDAGKGLGGAATPPPPFHAPQIHTLGRQRPPPPRPPLLAVPPPPRPRRPQ